MANLTDLWPTSAHGWSPVQRPTPAHDWDLIIGVLDVLEQHGYRQLDDRHTGRAIGMIRDLAATYTGADDG